MDINRISAYSNESAYWKCKCGYEWTNQIQCMVGKKWACPVCGGDYNATIVDKKNGYSCPYCNDRKLLKGFNSFGERHSELLSELYETGNIVLGRSPFEMLSNSTIKLACLLSFFSILLQTIVT
ncbi:zinc-ribbon domain-containing protein [Oribacterium sp. WCC10]|uniref:zinc-ribbon domain-containing protein n=1 Tax=Oribacterium sp. WCC10 TaxID=1855343 RepID=UPI003FA52980